MWWNVIFSIFFYSLTLFTSFISWNSSGSWRLIQQIKKMCNKKSQNNDKKCQKLFLVSCQTWTKINQLEMSAIYNNFFESFLHLLRYFYVFSSVFCVCNFTERRVQNMWTMWHSNKKKRYQTDNTQLTPHDYFRNSLMIIA